MTEEVLLVMLLFNSVTDIKSRTIIVWPNILASIGGLLFHVLRSPREIKDLLWGYVPGILLLLFSYMTRNAVGKGDGLVFLMAGCWLDSNKIFQMFTGTMILIGVFSGMLLMTKKVGRKTELPLAPFILGSYLGMILL